MQEVEGQEEKDRTFHLGEKTAPNVSLEVRRADSEESHPQIPSEWRISDNRQMVQHAARVS